MNVLHHFITEATSTIFMLFVYFLKAENSEGSGSLEMSDDEDYSGEEYEEDYLDKEDDSKNRGRKLEGASFSNEAFL